MPINSLLSSIVVTIVPCMQTGSGCDAPTHIVQIALHFIGYYRGKVGSIYLVLVPNDCKWF